MCDYSLHAVATRPAESGEKLAVSKFPDTFTRGFAAVGDPTLAVCLRPGTELVFDQDVRFDGIFFRRKIGARLARFRQIDIDESHKHHDALEFANGRIVLLTHLVAGQTATVLQLPVAADKLPATKAAEPGVLTGTPQAAS